MSHENIIRRMDDVGLRMYLSIPFRGRTRKFWTPGGAVRHAPGQNSPATSPHRFLKMGGRNAEGGSFTICRVERDGETAVFQVEYCSTASRGNGRRRGQTWWERPHRFRSLIDRTSILS